ncbi:MAG: hypothetical protein PHS37_09405, partial [Candidatus Omnitrophica bacterium]|nr:hypothetical protein [Candidatus Omnitrophota bacterium]
ATTDRTGQPVTLKKLITKNDAGEIEIVPLSDSQEKDLFGEKETRKPQVRPSITFDQVFEPVNRTILDSIVQGTVEHLKQSFAGRLNDITPADIEEAVRKVAARKSVVIPAGKDLDRGRLDAIIARVKALLQPPEGPGPEGRGPSEPPVLPPSITGPAVSKVPVEPVPPKTGIGPVTEARVSTPQVEQEAAPKIISQKRQRVTVDAMARRAIYALPFIVYFASNSAALTLIAALPAILDLLTGMGPVSRRGFLSTLAVSLFARLTPSFGSAWGTVQAMRIRVLARYKTWFGKQTDVTLYSSGNTLYMAYEDHPNGMIPEGKIFYQNEGRLGKWMDIKVNSVAPHPRSKVKADDIGPAVDQITKTLGAYYATRMPKMKNVAWDEIWADLCSVHRYTAYGAERHLTYTKFWVTKILDWLKTRQGGNGLNRIDEEIPDFIFMPMYDIRPYAETNIIKAAIPGIIKVLSLADFFASLDVQLEMNRYVGIEQDSRLSGRAFRDLFEDFRVTGTDNPIPGTPGKVGLFQLYKKFMDQKGSDPLVAILYHLKDYKTSQMEMALHQGHNTEMFVGRAYVDDATLDPDYTFEDQKGGLIANRSLYSALRGTIAGDAHMQTSWTVSPGIMVLNSVYYEYLIAQDVPDREFKPLMKQLKSLREVLNDAFGDYNKLSLDRLMRIPEVPYAGLYADLVDIQRRKRTVTGSVQPIVRMPTATEAMRAWNEKNPDKPISIPEAKAWLKNAWVQEAARAEAQEMAKLAQDEILEVVAAKRVLELDRLFKAIKFILEFNRIGGIHIGDMSTTEIKRILSMTIGNPSWCKFFGEVGSIQQKSLEEEYGMPHGTGRPDIFKVLTFVNTRQTGPVFIGKNEKTGKRMYKNAFLAGDYKTITNIEITEEEDVPGQLVSEPQNLERRTLRKFVYSLSDPLTIDDFDLKMGFLRDFTKLGPQDAVPTTIRGLNLVLNVSSKYFDQAGEVEAVADPTARPETKIKVKAPEGSVHHIIDRYASTLTDAIGHEEIIMDDDDNLLYKISDIGALKIIAIRKQENEKTFIDQKTYRVGGITGSLTLTEIERSRYRVIGKRWFPLTFSNDEDLTRGTFELDASGADISWRGKSRDKHGNLHEQDAVYEGQAGFRNLDGEIKFERDTFKRTAFGKETTVTRIRKKLYGLNDVNMELKAQTDKQQEPSKTLSMVQRFLTKGGKIPRNGSCLWTRETNTLDGKEELARDEVTIAYPDNRIYYKAVYSGTTLEVYARNDEDGSVRQQVFVLDDGKVTGPDGRVVSAAPEWVSVKDDMSLIVREKTPYETWIPLYSDGRGFYRDDANKVQRLQDSRYEGGFLAANGKIG